MFELAWPWFMLLFLLPLAVRFLPAAKHQPAAALRVPFYHELEQLLARQPQTSKPIAHSANRWLILLIWICLIAALLRPQWVGETVSSPLTGRDLLMAVDISGSMEAPDMELNGKRVDRLTLVKHVAGQFIQQRLGDRVGLLLFGSQAYLQTPLTHDRSTVAYMLNEAVIGLAGKSTAIGDAIGLAIKRLRERPQASRVLILLTDGDNTAGEADPRDAAKLAAENDIRIYTIGLGSDQMEVSGLFGSRTVNPSRDLDEALLKDIASMTGGRFFRAKNTEQLQQVYQSLDELEPSEGSNEYFRPRSELYAWPLGLAFLLSLLLGWLRGVRR